MGKKLITTPAGIFVFPRLTGAPDTKFDEAGLYSTKIRFTADVAAPLVEEIDNAIAQAVADAKEGRLPKQNGVKPKKVKQADPPYSVDEDTGDVTVNFKMKATGTRKDGTAWSRKPAIFDAAGKPVTKSINIGGGTKGKVSYEMDSFFTALVGAGVSLRLQAAQVIELVEFGSRDASAYGFAVEEGYAGRDDDDDAGEQETEEESPTGEAPAGDDNDGDF